MEKIKKLPTRGDAEKYISQTWNLKQIFSNDRQWQNAYEEAEKKIKGVSSISNLNIDNGKKLFKAIFFVLSLMRYVEKIYSYASLKSDQDLNNTIYISYLSKAEDLVSKAEGTISFLNPLIISFSDKQLKSFYETTPQLKEYQHLIDSITKKRGHILSTSKEKFLASLGNILLSNSKTFSVLNDVDLKFGEVFNGKGKKIELTHGRYDLLIESRNRKIRKAVFKKYYHPYHEFINTFASTLYGQVKTDNFLAKVHGFKSARQAALYNNFIPEIVFQNLLNTTNKHIGLLHKYVRLRKKILNLKDLHNYDLYVPLVNETNIPVDREYAKEIILKALSPLGKEYLEGIQEEFDNRWVDFPENKGKRSGAYSDGSYDTYPYILLNWEGTLDDVFTLAHESGHSQHSFLTRKNQPYQYGDYSIFLAEIASTTNEILLTNYLLKTQNDFKLQAYILNHFLDDFKGTFFRQTQFAEFEDLIHKKEQNGEALTATNLSKLYSEINNKFYGKDLVSDPEIGYEWSRIPHFYYNYYVYQYATGEAAAIYLAKGIIDNPKKNVPHYIDFLSSGSSDYPLNTMKKTGIDMRKTFYLDKAFSVFENILTEFKKMVFEK